MNYTKGEWKVNMGIRTEKYFICALNGTNVPEGEEIANAHLIAAAPDMYSFLADLARAIDEGQERIGCSRGMILSTILAKAEGGKE